MRIQEARSLFTPTTDHPPYEHQLREAADGLLRALMEVADWSHPAAEHYRLVRAGDPHFGEES